MVATHDPTAVGITVAVYRDPDPDHLQFTLPLDDAQARTISIRKWCHVLDSRIFPECLDSFPSRPAPTKPA